MSGMIINPYSFGTYHAAAVSFDGTNDYLTRGADFTGSTDSKVGTVSFWLKRGTTGVSEMIYANESVFNIIDIRTTNKIRLTLNNPAASPVLDVETTTAVSNDGNWHHIAFAWDLVAGTALVYRDGSADKTTTTAPVNDTPDWTRTNHAVGARTTGANKLTADVADIYLNIAAFIDISVAGNLAKFISGGKPVFLGNNGSVPTGTAPLLFLSGSAGNFATNKGGGGGMTTTGTLTDAATSPSD